MTLATSPSFGSLDYLNRVESLHTPLLSEDATGTIARHADVLMLVGAPEYFEQIPEKAYFTLFFDNHGQQRKLPENSYQITCPERMEDAQFSSWATQASLLLQQPFLRQGAVGLDLADLGTVLSACSSRRLIFQIIEYDSHNQLSLCKLSGLGVRNLFACLYGDLSIGLSDYAKLGNALEQGNPEINEFKIAMFRAPETKRKLILLSEPIPRPQTHQSKDQRKDNA